MLILQTENKANKNNMYENSKQRFKPIFQPLFTQYHANKIESIFGIYLRVHNDFAVVTCT